VKLPSRAAAPLLHPCREPGCTEEGSFGEGVDLLKGQPGTWRCHRHEREHRVRQAAAPPVVAESVLPAAAGRLL
jgi:hypothetical protein